MVKKMKIKLIVGMLIITIVLSSSGCLNSPTQEELSNPQLINAFCQNEGYDYGISYYTDPYNQSDSYPVGELNRVGIFSDVTCYRTLHQQEHFSNYGYWVQNKVFIYSKGE